MNSHAVSAFKGNFKTLVTTGSVLAAGGMVSKANVVYSDVPDLTISNGQTIYFNLATSEASTDIAQVTGGGQFQLLYNFGTAAKPMIQGTSANGMAALSQDMSFAAKLSSGTPIDSGLSYSAGVQLASAGASEWEEGDRGFLGLRLDIDGAQYGWADVSYNADQSLTLYSFALDDSGSAISAGVVPEPTTAAFAVMFAGSLTAFEMRRRRKAAKKLCRS